MAEIAYSRAAASGYEQAFALVTRHFSPFLIRDGRVGRPGQRVLDIGTGTGLAAEAALAAVGPSGHVTAADLSPDMIERARERLGGAPNVTIRVEDGQALTFPDNCFDSVICSSALMLFPDPGRGLAEFYRVLRPGGHAAVSVNTVPEGAYTFRVFAIIARYEPALRPMVSRMFALGTEGRLGPLFTQTGFQDVSIATRSHRFPMPSFDAYFEQFERGWGVVGQAFLALSEANRQSVREEVRRDIGGSGGPIEVGVELMFGSGRK
jgi:ubiquinone/menaquinone biosynthesis C-methylase UbiE